MLTAPASTGSKTAPGQRRSSTSASCPWIQTIKPLTLAATAHPPTLPVSSERDESDKLQVIPLAGRLLKIFFAFKTLGHSCRTIMEKFNQFVSRAYWIKTSDGPLQTYCDMDNNGGGEAKAVLCFRAEETALRSTRFFAALHAPDFLFFPSLSLFFLKPTKTGWTLLVTAASKTWTTANIVKRNSDTPSLSQDFSFLQYGRGIVVSLMCREPLLVRRGLPLLPLGPPPNTFRPNSFLLFSALAARNRKW